VAHAHRNFHTITRSVRGRLEAITRDRNALQKHAWGAAIILSSAGGVGTNEIMRRTQPGLPLKKGRLGTMTHDYKRHGTTTLFAELNVLAGTVIGRNMQRHRHQEFMRFLNAIEAEVPAGKMVHVILDNYVAHKQLQ
jgi:hypothetical protein